MSLRAKKKHRKPFVVTVMHLATAAAVVPGCASEVVTNPPAPFCPPDQPADGDPCVGPITCDYGADACGVHTTASCTESSWQVELPNVSCNPPPPPAECPLEPPVAGETCFGFGTCNYSVDFGCGPQPVAASCYGFDTGVWEVTTAECVPPMVDCASLTAEADCTAQLACRWLVPGCDTPPLPQVGCFPATDCTTDTDCTIAGQVCTQVAIDPCYMKGCNACAMMVSVCLTP